MWEEAGGPSKVGQQIVNIIINHLMIQGCELGYLNCGIDFHCNHASNKGVL